MIYDYFVKFFMDVMVLHNIIDNNPKEIQKAISVGLPIPLNQDGKINFILQKKPSVILGQPETIITNNDNTQTQSITSRVKESWQIDWLAYNKTQNNTMINVALDLSTKFNSIMTNQQTMLLLQDYYANILAFDTRFTIQDISSVEMMQNVKRFSTTINILVNYNNTYDFVSYKEAQIESVLNT